MKMHTLFISDLHLDAKHPKHTNTFFYFLEHIAIHADALYILGDFFELYLGDDDYNYFTQSIIHALAHLKKSGVAIFLMQGNHDFLIGNEFIKQADITLIPDPTVIELYNQKFILMHGDSLCTKDKSFQRFRKITRNKLIQKLFLLMPLSFRKKMADQLRQDSRKKNTYKSNEMMDVSPETVNRLIKQYGADKLIHGHTHKPQIGTQRIVLDAWHEHGNYLQINQDGKMELVNISH